MSQKCEQLSYGTFGGIFGGFLVPFFLSPKSIKFRSVFGSEFYHLLDPFGINFLYISWPPKNECFATHILRNACFCFSRPPILASNIHPKNMFFQDTFQDTLLHDFMLIVSENCRFRDTSKSSGRQNGTPNRPSSAKMLKKTTHGAPKTCSWNKPASEMPPDWVLMDLL